MVFLQGEIAITFGLRRPTVGDTFNLSFFEVVAVEAINFTFSATML